MNTFPQQKRVRTVTLVAALMAICVLAASARKKRPEPPSSLLTVVVLKGDNGEPLRNAAVVLHPVNSKDKQESGGFELKTDAEGKASYEGLPYGRLRIQVLAKGFQTFGQDYEINQPGTDLTIKMERPTRQYSIYEDHPGDKADKADKKDAPPDAQPKPQ